MPAPRRLIVAVMRDEAPWLVEWMAWHLMAGFDHVLVYTNDCADLTEPMLDRLAETGHVTRLPNPASKGEPVQRAALAAAMRHPLYLTADWVAHIDVDEFVLVHAGAGRVQDLLEAVPDANMISLAWRSFGASGRIAFTPAPVTERFRRAAPPYVSRPWQITAFKTLHRPLGHWREWGAHRPHDLAVPPEQIRWVNGDGAPMPERFLVRGWRAEPGCFGDGLAQLNHHPLKSAEEYLVKAARGWPMRGDVRPGLDYWKLRDVNMTEDGRAAARLPALRAAMDALLSDPALAALQRRAEDDLRAAIARLKAEPATRALFDAVAARRPGGSFRTFRDGERIVHELSIPDVERPNDAF